MDQGQASFCTFFNTFLLDAQHQHFVSNQMLLALSVCPTYKLLLKVLKEYQMDAKK